MMELGEIENWCMSAPLDEVRAALATGEIIVRTRERLEPKRKPRSDKGKPRTEQNACSQCHGSGNQTVNGERKSCPACLGTGLAGIVTQNSQTSLLEESK